VQLCSRISASPPGLLGQVFLLLPSPRTTACSGIERSSVRGGTVQSSAVCALHACMKSEQPLAFFQACDLASFGVFEHRKFCASDREPGSPSPPRNNAGFPGCSSFLFFF